MHAGAHLLIDWICKTSLVSFPCFNIMKSMIKLYGAGIVSWTQHLLKNIVIINAIAVDGRWEIQLDDSCQWSALL
jgi:hypothetical protein